MSVRIVLAAATVIGLCAPSARADSALPGDPSAGPRRTLLAADPYFRVEVEGTARDRHATRVTLFASDGKPLTFAGALDDHTPLPLFDRIVKAGPGGGDDPPFWFLLLGWSSTAPGMQTNHAWLVGVGKDGIRVADRFDVTTDGAGAGFLLGYGEGVPSYVDRIGLPRPDPSPRSPDAWRFVMCGGHDFYGLDSFTSLPFVPVGKEKTEWYLPPAHRPASADRRARAIGWFSPSPCFHAVDPDPRPYKYK